jgi:succinylglutamic semialdehyde dehydrogenase
MSKLTSHYINGNWVESHGARFTSTNPANGALVWQGQEAADETIIDAYNAARNALPAWSQMDFKARVTHIKKFGEQIEAKRKELTLLIAHEAGKPLWEAATEVSAVIGKINLSIRAYEERTPEKINPNDASHLSYKPHGVIAVLGPFNFPAHLSNGHIVPALLAGNTVVYKPSELTPAVAEFILQSWHDSQLPAGVINGIQGGAHCAKKLLEQSIQGVFFTGSYQTGLQINKRFSEKPEVILALEMGGNNPLIIDTVNDLNSAVYNSLLSTFITAGQRCTCARRLLVADNEQGDQFLSKFIQASKALRVGAYTDTPEPFMGPVIRHEHALKHLEAQDGLIKAGGNSLLSMSLLAENTGLLSPGIIDMSDVNHPADEEIFAPLVQVYRYREFEEAIQLANQTRYGLAAGLFSNDEAHYQEFLHKVRAGLINWNRPTTGASSSLPFGGIGYSGNHRPSAYFAADYCAYPVASMEEAVLVMPEKLLPGIVL